MAESPQDAAGVTFEQIATEEEKGKVVEVREAITAVVEAATSIEVRNAGEAEAAIEFLSRVASEKKTAEAARKFLVKPLNDHVKAINEQFKATTGPLEEADGIVRAKVLTYRADVEAKRAAEQARLDAEHRAREQAAEDERRRQEAEARAAREAAAREAARAEQEAARAAALRREEMARERSDLERRVSRMPMDELTSAAAGDGETAAAAQAELARRRAAREAQEAIAAARQREEDARAAEQAIRDAPPAEVLPAVAAAPAPLVSASGSASERKRWTAEVYDPLLVPRAYLMVDQKKLNAAVKDGVREIPGVRIEQVHGLAVRAG